MHFAYSLHNTTSGGNSIVIGYKNLTSGGIIIMMYDIM